MNEERKFFTVSQLVEYLGNGVISRSTVYLIIKDGTIPVIHIGTKPLIPASWVDDFVNSAKPVAKAL